MDSLYDVVIIGGGPAGVAAGVYCARKKLKTLLITESFGGQSFVSDDIQNWIGEPHISGLDLAKKLEAHIRSYPDMIEIKLGEKAVKVKSIACTEVADGGRMCDFELTTDKGLKFQSKTVIVASGARRRKLGIPGEDKFGGKGVAYCSTCDAPLFRDKKVVVVGGGNAGLEAVQDLFPYASQITLMERGETLRGDPKTVEEIKKNPKLKEIILNAQTVEVVGETLVTGLKYKDLKTSEEKTLEVGGIFVEIGSVPNSEMVKDLVQLDDHGQIMVNFQHARTSHPGIFAAGDVTDDPYKQNNISAGDGVRAALAAYNYLLNREKQSPAAEKNYA
ncbi:FAD-dependent oxidoreductase [Candidatus Microgenomates bacterium]|nr:FAD-dependent oxidoreductase [Candidatus Microgenomates bacterium]